MMTIGIQISGVAARSLIMNTPQIQTVACDINAAVAAGHRDTGINHFLGMDPNGTARQSSLIEIDIHRNGIRLAISRR